MSHRPSAHRRLRCACEALETRVLLATIDWVNRGPGSDDLDLFGANEAAARAIVDRVIADWERVIVDFNYGDGTNTFDLTVLGFPGFPGQVVDIVADADGKPRSATMRLNPTDQRYFDPVLGTGQVPDDSEFDNFVSPFKAFGPVNLLDLYTVASHELGHALGIAYRNSLAIADFVELDEWVVDPLNPGDGCAPNDPNCNDHGNHVYPVYVNGSVRYTMTDAGTDPPNMAPSHLYEGPPVNNWPSHPDDLLADGRDGDSARRLISDVDAGFLRDVYDYTVLMPSQVNTFYANLDTVTDELFIVGDPANAIDTVTVDIDGSNLRVAVNGTTERFPLSAVDSITIDTDGGDDLIRLFAIPSGVVVNVINVDDEDVIDIGNGDVDNEVRGPITIDGTNDDITVRVFDHNDTGNDSYTVTNTSIAKPGTLFGGVTYDGWARTIVLTANEFDNTIFIESSFIPQAMTINGRGGNDTFFVGGAPGVLGGAVLGDLSINGGLFGTDRVFFDDSNGAGQDIYALNGANYQQTGSKILTFSDIEAVELRANDEGNGIAIANTFGYDFSLEANGGDDLIDFGFGTLATTGDATIFGGDGADVLRLNDTSAFAPTTFTVNQTGGLPFVELFNASQLVIYDSIANLIVDGGRFADTMTSIAVPSLTSLRMNGNGGNDVIEVQGHPTQNSALFPRVTVTSGAGDDIVRVNTDGQGGARAEFIESEVLDQLAIGASGRLRLAEGEHLIDVQTASLPASGFELDLTDGFFVRRGNGSFPFYTTRLAVGYNGGTWDGLGINSSTAANSPASDALGIARASELFGGGGGVIAGINLQPSDIIIRHALYGDADLNGTVNLLDFNRHAGSFGQANTVWSQGNFNYDNATNLIDFNLLAGNFGQSLAPVGNKLDDSEDLKGVLARLLQFSGGSSPEAF